MEFHSEELVLLPPGIVAYLQRIVIEEQSKADNARSPDVNTMIVRFHLLLGSEETNSHVLALA